MNELEQLYRQAQAAIAAGKDPAAVDRLIGQKTGGRFTSLERLAQGARISGATAPDAESEDRPGVAENVRSGLREAGGVLHAAAHGASFGLTDEMFGALRAVAAAVPGGDSPGEAYRENRDAARGHLSSAREEMPLASGLSELTGGAALPGGIVAKGIARGAGIGRAALRGAATGAAGGAAYGAGSAEEDRVQGGIVGGLLGGVTGGVAGGAGSAATRAIRGMRAGLRGTAAKVGEAVGGRLKSGAGVTGEAATVSRQASQQARRVFRELDQIDELDHPAIRGALRDKEVAAIGAVPHEVFSNARPPSFSEAQKVFQRARTARERAWKRGDMQSFTSASRAERQVGDALEEATSGRFSVANEAYRQEMDVVRAITQGRRLATKGAGDIEDAAANLSGDALRGFREGVASRFVERLESGRGVRGFIDRANTPQQRRKLEVIFGGDSEAVDAFLQEIEGANVNSSRALWRRMLPYIAAATGGGGLTAAAGVLN